MLDLQIVEAIVTHPTIPLTNLLSQKRIQGQFVLETAQVTLDNATDFQ
jgi:hypothetical protein